MASVEIRKARKSYGETQVLHGVSVSVQDGEFVTLVGPSGCGKSTLLKMIAGLEEITAGDIVVGGRVVNDVPPKDRDVAMVFQSFALYPHMTVAQNMGFSLRVKGRPATEIRSRVTQAADMLGLGDYLDRLPRQLSGGQRQRVAMGRAVVREPAVFLFDEPLSNLDAILRVQMRAELKQMHRRLGTTTIFVTHDQVEAMTMADRIVLLNAGRVEQAGTPLELYDTPRNRFVAGFMGSPAMNFLSGKIQINSAPKFISDGGIGFPLLNAPRGSHGRPVVCGIRPEHFQLGEGDVEAEILEVDPTGSETHILAKVGHHEVVGIFRERVAAARGERIRFAPTLSRIHIFDAVTEMRIA